MNPSPQPHPDTFETRLGHRFANRALLMQALTHASVRGERPELPDNQRLEFLGDAALGLALAEQSYLAHPHAPEGLLTTLRAGAANTATLARAARALDLGDHLILGRGEEKSGGRTREGNLADALEAVFGAVYLDGGLDAVRHLVDRHLAPYLDPSPETPGLDNPKGDLQEWAQRQGLPCPVYTTVSNEGPDHRPEFIVEVTLPGHPPATGHAPTKRQAEALAARSLFNQIAPPGP
jgi:ribonuclease-3